MSREVRFKLTRSLRQNVCGMSVVGQEFEKLKRFNLAEIYQASKPEDVIRRNDSI
jgi:hypothetical protein